MYHVEYAPDGRTFVTAGQDKTARIWDAETGRARLVLRGHEEGVDWASFDPSGTWVVTVGDDATVRIWSASDSSVARVLDRLPSRTVAALFTPDGRDVIAAARDGTLVRWDAATGRQRATTRVDHRPEVNWVETLAISPQGTTLALTGKAHSVCLYDLSQGGLAVVTRPVASMGTNGQCVVFAPDGRSLAATGWNDFNAVIYDPATGKQQVVLKGPVASCYTAAFAPDGRTLAVGDGGGTLRLWDLATRSCQVSLLGHTGGIWCVAFAPDGRTLVTTGRDGTIRLWDAKRRSDRAVFRVRNPMASGFGANAQSVAFSADSTRVLAAQTKGCVVACNLGDGSTRILKTDDHQVIELWSLLAPDGGALAVGRRIEPVAPGTGVENWRFKTVVYDLSGRRAPITLPPVVGGGDWRWSPEGRRLALAESTGDLTLWDSFTGRLLGRAAAGFGRGSSSPAFLPEGDGVIAVCGENVGMPRRPFNLVVWKPSTSQLDRRPIEQGQLWPAGKVVLAPDGQNLADVAGSRARLWDFPALRRRFVLVGHGGDVTDLAFAPDGRTLATTSVDKTVRLWSVASGQELLVLDGHTGWVRAVAFSPDGRMLASCGDGPDGGIEVIVWYAEGSARAGPSQSRTRSR